MARKFSVWTSTEVETDEITSLFVTDQTEEESEKEKLYSVMEEATKFFEKKLSVNNEAQKYLLERGVNEKTMKDFRLGYGCSLVKVRLVLIWN